MKNAWHIGKILGVETYIHWTFSFLIGWIVVSNLRGGIDLPSILWSIGFFVTMFSCVLLHELGHAFTAKYIGIGTNNIMLFPLGGVAQMESLPEEPRKELLISLAGPAVNLIIAALLLPFIHIHDLVNPENLATLKPGNFLFFLVMVNVWLAVFNLIPAFPLDGGKAFRAILAYFMKRNTATRIATGIGQVFGAVFFFAGFLYSPSLIFVGLFIFIGGQYESDIIRVLEFLHRYTVKDAIIREIPSMESRLSIRQAANLLLSTQNKNFLVTFNGEPVGTIGRDDIANALEEMSDQEIVDRIKNTNLAYVPENMPLDEAWSLMQKDKSPMLLVGKSKDVKGILEADNLSELMLFNSMVAMTKR
jgi:Zn-dependent protease/predicted transcriptional regulator